MGLIYEASGGYDVPFLAIAVATLAGFAILAGYAPRPIAAQAREPALTPGRDAGGAHAARETQQSHH
jgi:hypothetical protein